MTEERRAQANRLLESLTPGGSEFHDDLQYCARWLREHFDALERANVALAKELEQAESDLACAKEFTVISVDVYQVDGGWELHQWDLEGVETIAVERCKTRAEALARARELAGGEK